MLFTSVTQFAVLGLLLLVGWLFGFASHPGGKRWKNAYEEEAVGRAQDRDELDSQLRAQDRRIAALEQEKAELEARVSGGQPVAETRVATPVAAAPVAAAPLAVAPIVHAEPVPAPVVVAEPVTEAPAPPVYLSRITPDVSAPVAASAARPAFPPTEHAPAPEPAVIQTAPAVAAPEPVQAEYVEVAPSVPIASAVPLAAAEPAPEPAPLPIKRGWFDWGKGDDLTRLRGVDGELETRLKAENVDRFSELANLNDQEEIALERRLDLPAGYIMKEQLREQARLLAAGQDDEHAQRFG